MSATTNSRVVVDAHHAEVRLEGGERVVGDLGLGRRDAGDERATCPTLGKPTRATSAMSLSSRPQPALLAAPRPARRTPAPAGGWTGSGRCPARPGRPRPPASGRPPATRSASTVAVEVAHDRPLGHLDDQVVAAGAVACPCPGRGCRWSARRCGWSWKASSEATLRSATSHTSPPCRRRRRRDRPGARAPRAGTTPRRRHRRRPSRGGGPRRRTRTSRESLGGGVGHDSRRDGTPARSPRSASGVPSTVVTICGGATSCSTAAAGRSSCPTSAPTGLLARRRRGRPRGARRSGGGRERSPCSLPAPPEPLWPGAAGRRRRSPPSTWASSAGACRGSATLDPVPQVLDHLGLRRWSSPASLRRRRAAARSPRRNGFDAVVDDPLVAPLHERPRRATDAARRNGERSSTLPARGRTCRTGVVAGDRQLGRTLDVARDSGLDPFAWARPRARCTAKRSEYGSGARDHAARSVAALLQRARPRSPAASPTTAGSSSVRDSASHNASGRHVEDPASGRTGTGAERCGQSATVGAGDRQHVDELAALAAAELHLAVGEGEQRVVAAAADVLAGVEAGAPLAHDDGARR